MPWCVNPYFLTSLVGSRRSLERSRFQFSVHGLLPLSVMGTPGSGEKLKAIHVMPKFCRQFEYCLKNNARDFTICLTANFCIQANCVLILCLVCVCGGGGGVYIPFP